jgi:hypothetical protein
MNVEELLKDYDWEEVFKYALDGVKREDVAEVVASVDGVNDGAAWSGVFRLKDGRFMFISASCDYTGWGCQEGGSAEGRPTLAELVAIIPDNELERLPSLRSYELRLRSKAGRFR